MLAHCLAQRAARSTVVRILYFFVYLCVCVCV
jgi:hypothetical protein